MKAVIELNNVNKDIKRLSILKNINIKVNDTEIHALICNNGAGKTTLIRCILGLYKIQSGDILVLGDNPYYMKQETKKEIGVIFDRPCLIEELDAIENLKFFSSFYNISYSDILEKYKLYIEILNFFPRDKQIISSYSKGMKQKLAIIRAIMHQPKLLVLDEPFSGLDPKAQIELKNMITYLNENGTTILISSHNLNQLESIATNVTMINDGRVTRQGNISDLLMVQKYQFLLRVSPNKVDQTLLQLEELQHISIINVNKTEIIIQVTNEIGDNVLNFLYTNNIQVLECSSYTCHLESLFLNSEEN